MRIPLLNTEFRLDLAIILGASLTIATAAHQLLFMTIFVPLLMGARLLVWKGLPADEKRHKFSTEVVFLLVCIVLGGFNDWNSVVHKRIYDYTVPVYFPDFSTIPIWMLLLWGIILRFMVSLFRLPSLNPLAAPDNRLSGIVPRQVPAWLRVTVLLLFVLVTRQAIYRWYLDPLWSWLPFAAAIVVYPLLFPSGMAELKLGVLALLFGPAVEALYILVGGLHRYHLPVLGGVPLWIILWWVLIIPIWRDLSTRILIGLEGSGAARL